MTATASQASILEDTMAADNDEKDKTVRFREDCIQQLEAGRHLLEKDDWARVVEVNEGDEVAIPGASDPAVDEALKRMCFDF